ncbi:hypothetical protein [Paracraurococcus ruber]|nr:hypothetical protein [Paracraurococcus ruber]
MLKPDAAAATPEQATGTQGARSSDVRGVIDNLTPDALYGWAWDFGHPEHRVRVVLRIGGRTLAEAMADSLRPDLAKAGIGDGRHAFTLPLGAEARERLGEAVILGFGADGREFQIPARLPRREEPAPGGGMQRVLEGVIAEQREMRQALAALQAAPGGAEAAARATEPLATRIEELELWLSRLDDRLAGLDAPAAPEAKAGGIDPWQAGLYALLASLSVGALAAAFARWAF